MFSLFVCRYQVEVASRRFVGSVERNKTAAEKNVAQRAVEYFLAHPDLMPQDNLIVLFMFKHGLVVQFQMT